MLKNRTIGKKLIITFIFVGILSSVGGIIGLSVMTNMNAKYSKALTDYGFAQGDIGLFNTEFNSSSAIIRDIINTDDVGQKITYSAQLNQSNSKVDIYFTNMKKRISSDKERKYYNDISSSLSKFTEVRAQVVSLALQNKSSEAKVFLTEQVMPISNKIAASTNALISEKTAVGSQVAADLSHQAATATGSVLAIILISLVISFLIAIKISRGISKPVNEMAKAAQKMAQGDLNVEINVSSKDEIGQLGASFRETAATLRGYIADITASLAKVSNGDLTVTSTEDFKGDFVGLKDSIENIVTSLNDIISQISQSSEHVLSGSGQVSNGAQALAQGAAEQASSVEELSATITEISEQVKDNAEHAASASLSVNQVRAEIEAGNQYMGDMVAAMEQINDSSREIGKIIKTIDDIAFQTNILALNAAVEAARAGSAGKGFAVVADEVRNLAGKSAEAAKSTTAMIEKSVSQVEKGTEIANKTAQALLQVVESAKAATDTVTKISQASNRQSDAIGQVTLGVEQISNVVQTNSATAEESAAASEALSEQAQALKQLVRLFKLKSQTDGTVQDEHSSGAESEPQQEQREEPEQSR